VSRHKLEQKAHAKKHVRLLSAESWHLLQVLDILSPEKLKPTKSAKLNIILTRVPIRQYICRKSVNSIPKEMLSGNSISEHPDIERKFKHMQLIIMRYCIITQPHGAMKYKGNQYL